MSDSANAELINKVIKDTSDTLVSINTHLTPEGTKRLIAIAIDVLSKYYAVAEKKENWETGVSR